VDEDKNIPQEAKMLLFGQHKKREALEERTLDVLADVALRAGIMALVFAKIASPSPSWERLVGHDSVTRHNR